MPRSSIRAHAVRQGAEVRHRRSERRDCRCAGRPGAGGPGPGGGSALEFSDDSKWVAFTTYPTRAEAQRLRRQRRPVQSGVTIVNLATGEKKRVSEDPPLRVLGRRRRRGSRCIARRRSRRRVRRRRSRGAGGGGGRGGGAGAARRRPSDRPRGTDLILRELATGPS